VTAPAVVPRVAPRRVCFFGTYARSHTSNLLLRQAFANLGWSIDEVHVPLWEDTRDKMPDYFSSGSLARLAARYAGSALRLVPRLFRGGRRDLYVCGFNGQLDTIVLRALRWRVPVLFAPLVSITETLVDDRQVHAAGSSLARLGGAVDRLSLGAATRVVIDTEAHRDYLIERLGVAPAKVDCRYLGADPNVFRPYPLRRGGPLRVLFYGQFLPLHGVDTILAAMAALSSDPGFEFTVVGTGPERRRALAAVPRQALDRLRLIEWVSYEELGELIAGADLCLGTFGTSAKARMVVPNKVYQAAAVGRAVLTSDTPALREVFTPQHDIAVCSPSAEALVEGIRCLRSDDERERIAANAARLMATRFSPQAQAEALDGTLQAMVRR